MSHRPDVRRWEYKLVSMGNPLEPDVELRANVVGRQGWDLAAIDAGVWVFKREVLEPAPGPLEAIIEETVPVAETAPLVGEGGASLPVS